MSLSNWTAKLFPIAALSAALSIASVFGVSAGMAAEAIYAPGQPIVTGFPGVRAADTMPDGSDPLDYTFIDADGRSLAIQSLDTTEPPEGQLIETSLVYGASAADVGLVFGVALDDAPQTSGALAPNIYVAASSAFGLNLVVPDAEGNPMRSRTGAPEASFAPGQWGAAGGDTGYPGSIWKIDGTTGEVSLFTTLVNSGPSLGALAFDSATQQFFVSDLDTGLIYRLALDGTIIDNYDHGVDGRPAHELEPVADDGVTADIADGAFDTEDPASWGFTPAERRVYGLTAWNGRLFYAVGQQIWSVRLNDDGSFGAARWELDVTAPNANEITSIAFDSKGRMILAQRGATVSSYDYTVLAEAGTSSVLRYAREFPDDPDTPSTWVETPDSYAVGVSAEGMNASGGIALGYGFDADTGAYDGACGTTVWASGDALRDNDELDPPLAGPAYVAGLQGVPRSWVRPLNDPATLSGFTDFDGNTDDDQASMTGHVGAVAMWQVCDGAPVVEIDEEPVLPPPDYVPAPDFNLTLEKWASPYKCIDGGANWWCNYTIRVENTGDVPYWGPITVSDYLPASNPGATMNFWPTPPWSCGPTGPTAYECSRGPVLLFPGDGVTLNEVVKLPKGLVDYCQIANVAEIGWPFGFGDDNPADDFDVGVAGIDAPGCVPPAPGTSDLVLNKIAAPWCVSAGANWACSYVVQVQNAGPANYTGPIQVKDTLGVNAPATTLGPWACAQAGPVLTCDIVAPPVNVPPGWNSAFLVTAKIKKTGTPPLCALDNKANISVPVGGPTNSVAGNDFDSATAKIPVPGCLLPQPKPDLQAKKQGLGCGPFGSGWYCEWKITITNVGPDPYAGPLEFNDKSLGAVATTLPGVAPYCAGPASDVDCNPVGPVWLAPGVPHSVTFYTFYNGGADVCSATNTLTIVNPSPGSALNPAGNDSASVNQAIPNPACAGLAVLNIVKTAKGLCVGSEQPGLAVQVRHQGEEYRRGPPGRTDQVPRHQWQADDFQYAGLRAFGRQPVDLYARHAAQCRLDLDGAGDDARRPQWRDARRLRRAEHGVAVQPVGG